MAVISRPYSARLRFINDDDKSVQSWSRINPDLDPDLVGPLRNAVNAIRIAADPVTGGFYTVAEELVETQA